MNENSQKALAVLANLAGTAADELRPETELVADLGIDSPRALQLLVELEDEIGIEISDEQAAQMETVRDVIAFYESR